MAALAIIIGIVVFLIVGAFSSPMLGNANAGVLPGLGAGVWVAWLICRSASESRYNFLHPAPKEYKRSKPAIFQRIRDLLSESHVEYGDSWSFKTTDTQIGRIVADLRYSEEEEKVESGRNNLNVRKERVKRFLRLEAQMQPTDKDTTILQLDWHTRIEGSNQAACDNLISTLSQSLDSSLGNGVGVVNQAAQSSRLVPPWWLIGLTGIVVFNLAGNFISSFGGDESARTSNESRAKAIQELKNKLSNEQIEWRKYKQREGIQ